MTFTIRPLHFPTKEGGTSPNKQNASANTRGRWKTAKRKELNWGRRRNNRVMFQAGWLSGGGVGSVWDGEKEKLYFPMFGQARGRFPPSVDGKVRIS